jgi:hypothetical protein
MNSNYISKGILLTTLAYAVAGCGGDPLTYSSPVGINLQAKGEEVTSGVLVEEKNISTESGNPYGAFVGAARQELGREPGEIEVQTVTLLLGGSSRGVIALEQVLVGRAEVQFVMNDTNNSFNVAHLDNPRGTGPVKMDVDYRAEMFQAEDRAKLIGGNFKVVLRSMVASGFAGTKEMMADLQATFQFAAYE